MQQQMDIASKKWKRNSKKKLKNLWDQMLYNKNEDFDVLTSTLGMAKKSISELEDMKIETLKNEKWREKTTKKHRTISKNHKTTINGVNTVVVGIPEGKERNRSNIWRNND